MLHGSGFLVLAVQTFPGGAQDLITDIRLSTGITIMGI